MLNSILTLMFGKAGSQLSIREREVSDSIRRLKTLTCRDGRVSIDPIEVLTPEYLASRSDARKYLTK